MDGTSIQEGVGTAQLLFVYEKQKHRAGHAKARTQSTKDGDIRIL